MIFETVIYQLLTAVDKIGKVWEWLRGGGANNKKNEIEQSKVILVTIPN